MVDPLNPLAPGTDVQSGNLHMAHGAQIGNFLPVEIALSDNESWGALIEGGFFSDEVGVGRKVAGQRVYFQSAADISAAIEQLRVDLTKRFPFDPTSQSAPQRYDENGVGLGVKSGDVFVVTADGTFDGQEVTEGDIMEAILDVPVGTALTFQDYYFNQAESGLAAVPEATENTTGTVKFITAIRDAAIATHEKVSTEKAVADALATLQAALNTAIAAVDAKADTNAQGIAQNAAAIDDRVKYQSATPQDIDSDINIGSASGAVVPGGFGQGGVNFNLDSANATKLVLINSIPNSLSVGDTVLVNGSTETVTFVSGSQINTTNNQSLSAPGEGTLEVSVETVGTPRTLTLNGVNVGDTLADHGTRLDAIDAEQDTQDTAIANNASDIADINTAQAVQDGRLDTLEEWAEGAVEIELGNGTDATIAKPITGKIFKDLENLVEKWYMKLSDGTWQQTKVGVATSIKSVSGTPTFTAFFAGAPAANTYKVRLVGLSK